MRRRRRPAGADAAPTERRGTGCEATAPRDAIGGWAGAAAEGLRAVPGCEGDGPSARSPGSGRSPHPARPASEPRPRSGQCREPSRSLNRDSPRRLAGRRPAVPMPCGASSPSRGARRRMRRSRSLADRIAGSGGTGRRRHVSFRRRRLRFDRCGSGGCMRQLFRSRGRGRAVDRLSHVVFQLNPSSFPELHRQEEVTHSHIDPLLQGRNSFGTA